MKKAQTGFAHLALILLLAIMIVVAFAGYRVVKNRQDKMDANTTSTAVTNSAETINTKADLDNATNTLNSESVDSTLNPASLDNDVSNLL